MVNQFSSIKQLELAQIDVSIGINNVDKTLRKILKEIHKLDRPIHLNGSKVSKELQRERNKKRIYS